MPKNKPIEFGSSMHFSGGWHGGSTLQLLLTGDRLWAEGAIDQTDKNRTNKRLLISCSAGVWTGVVGLNSSWCV